MAALGICLNMLFIVTWQWPLILTIDKYDAPLLGIFFGLGFVSFSAHTLLSVALQREKAGRVS